MLSEETHLNDIKRRSRKTIDDSLPRIFFVVSAVIGIWLISKYIALPIIRAYYVDVSLQVANLFVILILSPLVLKIVYDLHTLFENVADYMAIELAEPYGVTQDEISHFESSVDGVFNIILATLLYLMFVDFLSGVHEIIPAVLLVMLSLWMIYTAISSVDVISSEIRRVIKGWTEMAIT